VRRWSAATGLFIALFSVGAQAQAPRPVLLFKAPEPAPARLESWTKLVSARKGPLERGDLAWARLPPAIGSARLGLLVDIERHLAEARGQAAALREADALATLAQAASVSEQLGDVPGASAWQAEIQLRIGATAAQAGLQELAEFSFRRAALLEPGRRLLQAEAPPLVVAAYERVARQLALAPLGSFEVRSAAPVASVFLDDVLQGVAPLRVRAVVGRHLLRVQAAGYRPYGALVDVLEGSRPAIEVALSPEPALAAAEELERAARRGDYDGVVRGLRRVHEFTGSARSVLVIESSPDARRALLVPCQVSGCDRAERLPDEAGATPLRHALTAPGLRRDRAWLAANAIADESPNWWQRWYVWGGALVVTAAVGATLWALSREPDPDPRLRVVIEPGEFAHTQ
jgi:hypothetical protein